MGLKKMVGLQKLFYRKMHFLVGLLPFCTLVSQRSERMNPSCKWAEAWVKSLYAVNLLQGRLAALRKWPVSKCYVALNTRKVAARFFSL